MSTSGCTRSKAILPAIVSCRTIKTLHFRSVVYGSLFSTPSAKAGLIELLQGHPNLRCVKIRHRIANMESVRVLAEALVENPGIQRFFLSDVSDHVISCLTDRIPEMSGLQCLHLTVWLNEDSSSQDLAMLLVGALRDNHSIHEVNDYREYM